VDISQLERLLCGPAPLGDIEALLPRAEQAWSATFPGLASLPEFHEAKRRLRICIATEDIVGPVRNGGIGTTYAALAELLVELGHDTTILYLRGREVENEDLEYWIEFYAAKGIKFVGVPNYMARDALRTNANRWLKTPYNMLRYLIDHPTDVVHVSEWHGSGYFCLLAKRQGLAFRDTLFVVKSSSPWLWNRLYESQPLDRLDDLIKIYSERQSIELSDMVVSGSLHLLRWMSSQGYRLPRGRSFVQPNVVRFEALRALLEKRSLAPGTRLPIDEIVFFGRLEARKGLFVFCQAIKRLLRLGIRLPPKITFMGKPGARLMARPGQTVLEYLEGETRDWPVEVQILSEFQQYQAIEYLLDGNRLAVMPSTIENSSLAVYEAAICGIPFIASSVGGSSELIDEGDHAQVLCEPHPIGLADRLAETLANGGYIARPSFDNDLNLAIWRGFHDNLASGLLPHLLDQVAVEPPGTIASVSICIYCAGHDDACAQTLASLEAQELRSAEVLIGVDSEDRAAAARINAIAASSPLPCSVVECFDLDAGAAFNRLAQQAGGEFLLVLWEGSTLEPHGLRALVEIARSSGADVLNFFHRVHPSSRGENREEAYLRAVVLGSLAEQFFRLDLTTMPLFVKSKVFRELGGFTSDYRVLAHEYEFAVRAYLTGFVCQTALQELGSVRAWDAEWLNAKCYNIPASHFRAIRPYLAAAPLAMRDLLLMGKGLQMRGGAQQQKKSGVLLAAGNADRGLARVVKTWWGDQSARPGRAANGSPAAPPADQGAPLGAPRPAAAVFALPAGGAAGAPSSRAAAGVNGSASPEAVSILTGHEPLTRGNRETQKGIVGSLLAVRGGEVFGWVVDETDFTRTLVVEILEGGRVKRSVPAAAEVPTYRSLPQRLRRHGFAVQVFPSWLPRPLASGTRRVDLRIAGTDVMLAREMTIAGPTARIQSSAYRGYCDQSTDGRLRGWVWDPRFPDQNLEVGVFVDGKFLTRVPAQDYREDLVVSGISSGEHGFVLSLPRACRDGQRHVVEVFIADLGLALGRSPMVVVGNDIRYYRDRSSRRRVAV
jgi:glycosyltransferase involved in cell wall biosynthesis